MGVSTTNLRLQLLPTSLIAFPCRPVIQWYNLYKSAIVVIKTRSRPVVVDRSLEAGRKKEANGI